MLTFSTVGNGASFKAHPLIKHMIAKLKTAKEVLQSGFFMVSLLFKFRLAQARLRAI